MCQVTLIIISAFASQACTKELMLNHTANTKDAAVMDEQVGKFANKLVERVLKPLPHLCNDLEKTTLAKTSSRAWGTYARLYRGELTKPSSTLPGGDLHPLTPSIKDRRHDQMLMDSHRIFSNEIFWH